MKKYSIKELDGRYKGARVFKWVLDFNSVWQDHNRRPNFQTIRNWCWETFGPGSELETHLSLNRPDIDMSDRWCWKTDHDDLRIYFKSDNELSIYTLKWR